ncbi:Alkaline ceramidase 3 [Physocladia obscura]|uniref:Alkaline ceramidase 3 n=1 Tax=Physocladia obscura TaxID=109957 RepID=A0AAD5SY26_9FUNG|nr:Alkaline ceramidase 3 [Physocladia obscura]
MVGYSFWPAGKEGYWGPTTSTLDWCEENYIITQYIAEFWNTVSNLVFLVFAWIGAKNLLTVGVNERRNLLGFLSLVIVAIGSMMFHGTMWFNAQMLDELPMIYNGCILVFSLLTIFPEANARVSFFTYFFTGYGVFVTVVYVYWSNPTFLVACHTILLWSMVALLPIQIRHLEKTYPQHTHKMPSLWKFYFYGIASYLVGSIFWSIDNTLCPWLRFARGYVGTPVGILFEFHLWWHFFIAVGGYSCVMTTAFLRALALGREDIDLKWVWGVFPMLTHFMGTLKSNRVKQHSNSKKICGGFRFGFRRIGVLAATATTAVILFNNFANDNNASDHNSDKPGFSLWKLAADWNILPLHELRTSFLYTGTPNLASSTNPASLDKPDNPADSLLDRARKIVAHGFHGPKSENLYRLAYAGVYDRRTRNAVWVAERLTK